MVAEVFGLKPFPAVCSKMVDHSGVVRACGVAFDNYGIRWHNIARPRDDAMRRTHLQASEKETQVIGFF